MDQSNQIKYANDITFVKHFLDSDDIKNAIDTINDCERNFKKLSICRSTGGLCRADTPEFRSIHLKYLSKMEDITGLKLKPTYTFWRLSHKGTRLPFHADRPPCEISVTINVGYSDEKRWPFYVDHVNKHRIMMDPGDAVVYNGIKYIHWRNPLESDWAAQLCLHYVNANGFYKDVTRDAEIDQLVDDDKNHMRFLRNVSRKMEREYELSIKQTQV